LFKLVQTDPLRVLVNVPQNQMQMVRLGATADILIREMPGITFTGKVARTSGAFDPATRTMLVDLRVANPKGDLYTGMYAQARFHLQSAQPPLVVSGNALIVGGEGPRIAVVDGSDMVRIRKVRLGRDYGKDVEIVEGLREGERVVINPRDTLEDGMKVKAVVLETAPKADAGKAAAQTAEKGKS
jgi:RND family efflux transporter MFP subunit